MTAQADELGDRASDALEHLQGAARELIAAARAALDVADELVDDPETVAVALRSFAALGDLVRQRVGTVSEGAPQAQSPAADSGPTATAGAPRVERIRVV